MNIRRLTTFDKSDFAWSYIAIALAGLGVLVFAVLKPIVAWLRGAPLELDVLLPDGAPLDIETVSEVTAVGHVASLALADAPTTTWLLRIGLGLLFTAAVVAVLVLLFRFMHSIDADSPFTAANVRRLQFMAGILLIGPILAFWIQALWNGHLLSLAFGIELTWVSRIDNAYYAIFGFGTLLACIAEVFRRGLTLEDDVDGLV